MKIKAVSGIMLTLLLTSMLTLAFNITHVNAEIYLYDLVFIEPEEVQVCVGENLQIVVGFGYGFEIEPHPPTIEFSLGWDPYLLDIVSWVSYWGWPTVIVGDGYIRVIVSEPPYSTDLIGIGFKAKAVGDTILDLFDSNIFASDGFVAILPAITVLANVNIDPDALNLHSMGEWVTAHIELPEGYNVSDIDISTIMLNNTFPVSLLVVPPVPVPTEIGDYDDDDILDLMVKFNMTELTSYICLQGIKYGNVTLTITGEVNGTTFEGEDTVKVLLPGDLDHDGDVDWSDFGLFCASYPTFPPEIPIVLEADLEGDGDVDGDDFILFCGYYSKKL